MAAHVAFLDKHYEKGDFLVSGRQEPRGRLVIGCRGQAADHRAGRHVGGPGHEQGAALHADVAGRRLAQRGGDERRRGHRGAGQDRAIREEHPDVLATGVKYVIVNGKIAVDGGKYTGVLAGHSLHPELH